METTIPTNQQKIKTQMIIVFIIIIIVIIIGIGAIVLVRNGEKVSTNVGPTEIDISNLLGGTSKGRIYQHKTCIVIIALLIVLFIIILINSFKKYNNQLTEDDINQYKKQINYAQQIVGTNNRSPSEGENSLFIPGLSQFSHIGKNTSPSPWIPE